MKKEIQKRKGVHMNERSIIAKIIKRDSNYLKPHGSYIDDYNGIWMKLIEVSQNSAKRFIAEAIKQCTPDSYTYGPDNNAGNLDSSDIEYWMVPGNKDFVIFQTDGRYVYAIYHHDFKNFIVRAEGSRLIAYERNRRGWGNNSEYIDALVAMFE